MAADKEILNSLRGEAPPKAELLREFCFMMTLKDGKFYKDGQPYPLEFGNKEQIELLDKIQALQDKDGIVLRIKESHIDDAPFYTSYVCVCGNVNKKYWSEEQLNKLSYKFKCGGCQLNYTLKESDFSEFVLVIKLSK